jgi:hypothetical protein
VGRYDFLLDTYATERVKTLSVWSQIPDEAMAYRPEPRARTPREHMVHQCVSEHTWMRTMLDVDTGASALPADESRFGFIQLYANASSVRLLMLRGHRPVC